MIKKMVIFFISSYIIFHHISFIFHFSSILLAYWTLHHTIPLYLRENSEGVGKAGMGDKDNYLVAWKNGVLIYFLFDISWLF
jgi:hypothetical protein